MNDQDRAILAFEAQRWNHAGNKEAMILAKFGLSPTRYYQRLTQILDDPTAVQFDPLLTRRLQRIRDARAQQRSETS